MSNILRKLSSRKLWAAIVGVATGLGIVFGLDADTISTVSGAVVAIMSVMAYIITEGKIDAEAVKTAVGKVSDAVTEITEAEAEVGVSGSESRAD